MVFYYKELPLFYTIVGDSHSRQTGYFYPFLLRIIYKITGAYFSFSKTFVTLDFPQIPMKFTVLGSGSTGNSVLISTEKTRVLVDAGLSAKQTLLRLGEVGEDFEKLDGVLITHEHGDHAGGLRVLLNTVECPVFISEKPHEA